MPLDLLRSSALDEDLSPTDCSEDSVEIRSPTLFKPTPLKRSAPQRPHPVKPPEEKRIRLESSPAFLPSYPFLLDDRWPWRSAWQPPPTRPDAFYAHLVHPLPYPAFFHAPFFHHVPLQQPLSPPVLDPKLKKVDEAISPEKPKFLSVDTILGRSDSKTDSKSNSKTDLITEKVDELKKESERVKDTPIKEPTTQMKPTLPNRNYKNMTRERRMQANARERTRVHTISAAFEALRRAVPSFSHGQRLSKLSILRVASAYIGALSKLASESNENEADLSDCVDRCTRTLMTEGQMLRKKRPANNQSNHEEEIEVDDDFSDD